MIEIHAHVLPGLDDGAADEAAALALIQAYAAQGVTDIVCTSHFSTSVMQTRQAVTSFISLYRQQFTDLQQLVSDCGIAVRLHPGLELVLNTDLARALQWGREMAFNPLPVASTGYILVELPRWLGGGLASLEPLLFNLQMAGYSPVLAHPERIRPFSENLPVLAEWVRLERIWLQINASSLVPPGQATAEQLERHQRRRANVDQLIRQGLCHIVGSDAHHPELRPPQHREAYDVLTRLYGESVARQLLQKNPAALLADQPLATIHAPP